MIFEQIRTGGDRNFAYLVGDESTKKAAVVDPSYDPEKVLDRAQHHGLEVVYLINTHGHGDHTNGNGHVLSKTGAELVAGGPGGIEDGAALSLGQVELTFIHTPGHTEDGICILAREPGQPGKLVTGDTLFVGKVGGTGYGRDARDEYDAIHQKLMKLPDDTEVWPGHDYGVAPSSTIGNERRTNPFILRESFEAFVELKRNWLAYKAEHGIQ
jgi:glyoxylase-like metal-dependent hydrolase (beta-lactamase superfamily II)